MSKRTIKVDYLARVEGEGALYIETQGKKVIDVKLKIFEAPRFFEAFLRGRKFSEAPDITARICGICPVAYQMSTVHAMENILQLKIPNSIRKLRRLLYCGEWMESHALHIFMLHAPDFFHCQDAVELAKKHPDIVKNGLQIKKIGNALLRFLGGRDIHPINVRVGGFYKVPHSGNEFYQLKEQFKEARDKTYEAILWANTLPFPNFEQKYEFVSLSQDNEYPFNEGNIISNQGLNISVDQFDDYFTEEHVPYTNALHCVLKDRKDYLVGPMARFNLNREKLTPLALKAMHEIGLEQGCSNPFKSILIRLIEVLFACEEALSIIENYEAPKQASVPITLKAGTGYACTEAPRGILYHRYTLDDQGKIQDAKIIPPTSQNQKRIEHDLKEFVSNNIDLPDEELRWKCEQAVRNYDPCISCATHFLKLERVRL